MAISIEATTGIGFDYFPRLMKNAHSSLIILFVSKSEGTVIVANNFYSVGYYGNNWEDCTNNGEWYEYNGSITITNK